MSLTFDNRSGRYSPRNPYGEWFGLFGRNTPIRAGVTLATDSFSRTASNGWGTNTDGLSWTVESVAASDYSTDGSKALASHSTVNFIRRITFGRDWQDIEQLVTVTPPAVATGASFVVGTLSRHTALGYYWLRLEFDVAGKISVKISKRAGGVTTDIKTRSSIPGLTYAANQPWMLRTSVCGQRLSVKAWPAGSVEPVAWTLTAADDDADLRAPGKAGVGTWVVGGNTNTLPVVFSFDDYRIVDRRFFGEVPSWPPRADIGGFDRWTPITAYGLLRRLGQGKQAELSAMRRTIGASDPALYWPIEDGVNSGRVASAIPAVPPMTISAGVEFKDVETVAGATGYFGTLALADLSGGGQIRSSASVPQDTTASTALAWTIGLTVGGVDPLTLSQDLVALEWYTPGGTYTKWRLLINKTAISTQVFGWKPDDPNTAYLFVEDLKVSPGVIWVSAWQVDATHFSMSLYNGTDVADDTIGGVVGTFSGLGGQVAVNPTATTSPTTLWFGHVAAWPTDAPPPSVLQTTDPHEGRPVYSPWMGFDNEPAVDRLIRLCAERGVPADAYPMSSGGLVRMGPQPVATWLELIQECVDADGGILYEQRDGLGLVYRPRRNLSNRPELLIPYDKTTQPFEPADDDDQLVNDVTVNRKGGSGARVAREFGPLAALEPPAGVGVYDASYDLNLVDDDGLTNQASWRVHLGTVDEARYTGLSVDLSSAAWAGDPAGISRITAIDSGDPIAVTNLPAWLPPGPARIQAQGYTEQLDAFDWDLTWNGTPGSAWDTGVVGSSRMAANKSTLALPIASGDTSAYLTSTHNNGVWQTGPAHYPQNLRVGGELVTVSAIAPAVDDTFSRTVANGWGLSYALITGAASEYSVGAGLGTIAPAVVAADRVVAWQVGGFTHDILMKVAPPGLPTGGSVIVGPVARLVDSSNYYRAGIVYQTSGVQQLQVWKCVAGTLTSLGVASTGLSNAAACWVRFKVFEDQVWAKAWQDGVAEPTIWQVVVVDSSLAGAGSYAGAFARRETGNTGPTSLSADSLTVYNPQLVTISARGVNGVNRAWPVGTGVDIERPSVLAL